MRGTGGATGDPQAARPGTGPVAELLGELFASRGAAEAQSRLVRGTMSGFDCDVVAIAEEIGGVLTIVEATDSSLRGNSFVRPDQWDALFNHAGAVPSVREVPMLREPAGSDAPVLPCATALAAPISRRPGRELALLCISRQSAAFKPTDSESLARLAAVGSAALAAFGTDDQSGDPAGIAHRYRTLAAAVDSLADGIAITDDQFRFVYMNRAHLDLFGFSSLDEVQGKPDSILYSPSQFETIMTTVRPQILDAGAWRGELLATGKSGQCLRQDAFVTRIDGGGFLHVARDAGRPHDRERAMLLTARRNHMIGTMATGVTHDFNNLVSVITGSAQLIAQSAGATSVAHRHAERIQKAGAEAAQLVLRLLQLMLPDEPRGRIDLREPVVNALGLARSALGSNITLTSELPPQPVRANAAEPEVMHVVLNLVIGFRDALADQAGEISVGLDAVPADEALAQPCPGTIGEIAPGLDYARLRVAGIGRDAADDDVASHPEASLSAMEVGSDEVDLAAISEIVTSAGGAFRVSGADGTRLAFEVLWPLSGPSRPDHSGPEEPATADLQDATILVVDDISDIAEVISAMLEGTGAIVATCSDPAEALSAVYDDPDAWRLLVTDFDMPGMDGAELSRKCRAVRPDLPVLVCTAVPHHARQAADESQFDGILVKPFTKSELISAAARAIARREREERHER